MLGQNTTWLVVNFVTGEALTKPDDKRVSLKFGTREAADRWRMQLSEELQNDTFVVTLYA